MMNTANLLILIAFIGVMLIWELFSGRIMTRGAGISRKESPRSYWVGIGLKLVILAVLAWHVNLKVLSGHSATAQRTLKAVVVLWGILFVRGVLTQLEEGDSGHDQPPT